MKGEIIGYICQIDCQMEGKNYECEEEIMIADHCEDSDWPGTEFYERHPSIFHPIRTELKSFFQKWAEEQKGLLESFIPTKAPAYEQSEKDMQPLTEAGYFDLRNYARQMHELPPEDRYMATNEIGMKTHPPEIETAIIDRSNPDYIIFRKENKSWWFKEEAMKKLQEEWKSNPVDNDPTPKRTASFIFDEAGNVQSAKVNPKYFTKTINEEGIATYQMNKVSGVLMDDIENLIFLDWLQTELLHSPNIYFDHTKKEWINKRIESIKQRLLTSI